MFQCPKMCDFLNLIVSTMMAIMVQWKTCIHCKCMGLRKNSTSGMVDVKYQISWKVNSQTASTYDEDLVSFIKDRVLSPNALQQVTVGLQCIKSFSLPIQKGQNWSKITLHLIISAFRFKSVADICHFLSFDRFRIKPLVLNYKEYANNMYVICYHIIHNFSTMCHKH